MLEAFAFLGILNEPDIEWLVANSKRHDVPSGAAVIRQGEPVESLYLIVDGAFDVTVSVPKIHRVARLYAGELMGEMSFVDSRPPSATVTAAINSSVLAVAKNDLTKKFENDTGFAARFYRGTSLLLSGRLRSAFAEEPHLHRDLEDENELAELKVRFEEIQRRLASRPLAKGA